jgi:hypothetical protein
MSLRRRARRNVARVRRYPRRGVLPKVAPANPAETSVANVPNTPDGQFALWPGQDPNVHRLGFYEFEIEATSLDQALWAAELPTRQSPFLIIELSTSELKVVSETKDVSFVISSSAPLLQQAEIGNAPIRFKVKRHIMRSIRWMPGPLAFTFDRHSSLLRWIRYDNVTGEVANDFCTGAEWVPLAAPESGLRPLAVISGNVGGGIRYAATLIGRKRPPNFGWEGVQIERGSILGAYLSGVSRYRSPCLPESLTLNVTLPRNGGHL